MKTRAGLTLIELILTVGILGLAVGLTSGVIISVIKANQRSLLYSKIRHNGDMVLSLFEEKIKTARNVECLYPDTSPCQVILITDQNMQKKELGYHVSDINCSGGGSGNGYFYFRDYDQSQSNPSDSDKVTNDDPIDGINVSNVSFTLSAVPGEKPSVSLNFDVSNSNCSPVIERKESFSDFVILRLY